MVTIMVRVMVMVRVRLEVRVMLWFGLGFGFMLLVGFLHACRIYVKVKGFPARGISSLGTLSIKKLVAFMGSGTGPRDLIGFPLEF